MTGRIVDFEVIEVDIDTVESISRSGNIESVINSKRTVFKVSSALGKRGPVINSSAIKTPLDFLELFWTPEVMDTFVNNTNAYAIGPSKFKSLRSWKVLTVN